MTNEQLKQIFKENADCYFTMEMQSAMTETKFIEVVSELMKDVETKLKEPNFYIVNSIKYLTDEQRNSVAEKIAQMSTDDGDGIYDDNYYPTHWMPLPTHPQTKSTKTVKL